MSGEDFVLFVKSYASKNSGNDDIHGFLHVERVFNLCLRLGKELNANLLVLKIAALLHDIGRKVKKETSNNINHAELSAEMAAQFLMSQDYYRLSQEDFENVIHCIRSHSFSINSTPRTLEAKILSDADKLDALGAIGLYRTIGFTVKNEGNILDIINHLEEKIIKLKEMLFLDISKKIGKTRHKIILDFYRELKDEI